MCCIQWFKDTNLKANHNGHRIRKTGFEAVFNGSKILIWKQITTCRQFFAERVRCIQWFKDTNLKANHNARLLINGQILAVFNGSKILIWKQITTSAAEGRKILCCIQWFKDTNLKANHNKGACDCNRVQAVFNGSKILIWKQITTFLCFSSEISPLYSMVQRY